MRSTAFSPKIVGRIDTRKSISRTALGDVEVRHDLEPRDDRRLEPLGRGEHLVQHAVDAEPDAEDLLVGLPVDVGGALADRVDEHHVDELDDGRLVRRLLEFEDVDLARRLVLDDLDVADLVRELGHHVGDRGRLRVVVALDGLADRRLRGHHRRDLQVRHERDVVEREDVGGIGHRERQRRARALDRQDLVLLRDGVGDELEDLGVDVELRERDRRDPVLAREEADELLFLDEVELEEDRPELLRAAPLLREGLGELRIGDEAFGDEKVAETAGRGLPELDLTHGCRDYLL
jgi:hypothetical protein